MLFVPRESKYYIFFLNLKPWKRYGFTGAFLSIILAGWFFFVYLRIEIFIDSLQLQYTNERTLYDRTQELLQDSYLTQSIDTLQRKISTTYSSTSIQDNVMRLIKKIRNEGITISSIAPESVIDKKQTVVVIFKSSIHKIVSLLCTLATADDQWTYDDIDIKQSDGLYTTRLIIFLDSVKKGPPT